MSNLRYQQRSTLRRAPAAAGVDTFVDPGYEWTGMAPPRAPQITIQSAALISRYVVGSRYPISVIRWSEMMTLWGRSDVRGPFLKSGPNKYTQTDVDAWWAARGNFDALPNYKGMYAADAAKLGDPLWFRDFVGVWFEIYNPNTDKWDDYIPPVEATGYNTFMILDSMAVVDLT